MPGRLVNLGAPGPKPGSQSCNQAGDCDEVVQLSDVPRPREGADTAFSGIAAHRNFGANVAYKNQTLNSRRACSSRARTSRSSGFTPALGRLFTPNDDQTIGGHFVAVLGYAYWETKLGADPNVRRTRQIVINGQTMTIIGVAPKGFEGTTLGSDAERVRADHDARADAARVRTASRIARATGSICSRASSRACRSSRRSTAINAVYQPIINDVEAPLQKGMSAATMAKFKAKEVTLEDGRRGQSSHAPRGEDAAHPAARRSPASCC